MHAQALTSFLAELADFEKWARFDPNTGRYIPEAGKQLPADMAAQMRAKQEQQTGRSYYTAEGKFLPQATGIRGVVPPKPLTYAEQAQRLVQSPEHAAAFAQYQGGEHDPVKVVEQKLQLTGGKGSEAIQEAHRHLGLGQNIQQSTAQAAQAMEERNRKAVERSAKWTQRNSPTPAEPAAPQPPASVPSQASLAAMQGAAPTPIPAVSPSAAPTQEPVTRIDPLSHSPVTPTAPTPGPQVHHGLDMRDAPRAAFENTAAFQAARQGGDKPVTSALPKGPTVEPPQGHEHIPTAEFAAKQQMASSYLDQNPGSRGRMGKERHPGLNMADAPRAAFENTAAFQAAGQGGPAKPVLTTGFWAGAQELSRDRAAYKEQARQMKAGPVSTDAPTVVPPPTQTSAGAQAAHRFVHAPRQGTLGGNLPWETNFPNVTAPPQKTPVPITGWPTPAKPTVATRQHPIPAGPVGPGHTQVQRGPSGTQVMPPPEALKTPPPPARGPGGTNIMTQPPSDTMVTPTRIKTPLPAPSRTRIVPKTRPIPAVLR